MRVFLLGFLLLNIFTSHAQEGEFIKIENFIYNLERLKKNEIGVIIPQLDRSLNDRIAFFIEETFQDIIEDSKNIIWQSYQTTTNPILKSHFLTFTVRVSIRNRNQNKEHRYLEIIYFPSTEVLSTNYIWDANKRNFRLKDEELERRSYLPNLSNLKIENQTEKATIEDILVEYQQLLGGINDNFIYFNKAKENQLDIINSKISKFVLSKYTNVEFIMNIVFDSYHTFVSAYDKYHYYSFITQVKLKGESVPYFIEIFYNPTNKIANSDFLWSPDRNTYLRPIQEK